MMEILTRALETFFSFKAPIQEDGHCRLSGPGDRHSHR